MTLIKLMCREETDVILSFLETLNNPLYQFQEEHVIRYNTEVPINSSIPRWRKERQNNVIKVIKLASDNGFSQNFFYMGNDRKIFSCQNLDLSLS